MKTLVLAVSTIALATLLVACGAPAAPAPAHGIGVTWPQDVDSMVMVSVPAGEFVMGTADPTPLTTDEAPQHTVDLDAFWIDRTEVTNAMVARCVEAGKCKKPGSVNFGAAEFADHPVVSVTWDEAKTYCEWAGRRLPTEAEWEKAARGTDGRTYPWGNDAPDSVIGVPTGEGPADTIAVGSVPADVSPYGALGMFTGVPTWIADWYDENYYANSPSKNPQGPPSAVQPPQRAIRGGGWGAPPEFARLANRSGSLPDVRSAAIGFRCARSSP